LLVEALNVGFDSLFVFEIIKIQLSLGYLFELCYLAVPPQTNVSRSPGFEALGFFNTT